VSVGIGEKREWDGEWVRKRVDEEEEV